MQQLNEDDLARAFSAVPVERFHGEDGRAVRPCTPAHVTRRHLAMLDVPTGGNVLDIGAGSGLSGALLAALVGAGGRVTVVEISSDLAERAEALYARHGHDVRVIEGDGLFGHEPGGPYDRIFVGTTPPAVPDAWLRQLRSGGTLLRGVRISTVLPGAFAVARVTVDERCRPESVEIHHGGYTPMIGVEEAAGGGGDMDAFRAALNPNPHVQATPMSGDDYFHFKNWLIAADPGGLMEASLDQGVGVGIGVFGRDGTPHAAVVTEEHLLADDEHSQALDVLRDEARRWQTAGAPRTHDLVARLVPAGDAWHARVVPERRSPGPREG